MAGCVLSVRLPTTKPLRNSHKIVPSEDAARSSKSVSFSCGGGTRVVSHPKLTVRGWLLYRAATTRSTCLSNSAHFPLTPHRRKQISMSRRFEHRCQREIDRHQDADKSYMDEGLQILELARNAQRLFERQEPRQKSRLLNFVLSNCTCENGEVVATFRQPFDLLAETTAILSRHGAGNTAKSSKSEIWLGDLDSNQD
jgi:hypothetical protein